MKPRRRVIYTVAWDSYPGLVCYRRVTVRGSWAGACRLARALGARYRDVCVLRVKSRWSWDVTNRVFGRPGPSARRVGVRRAPH